MKALSELSTSELNYLRTRYQGEGNEFTRQIGKRQSRLDKRIERKELDSLELEALQQELATAEALLTHLQNTGASQSMIDSQQTSVDARQAAVNAANADSAITDEEAHVIQMEINDLQAALTNRQSEIAAIDVALAA